MKKVINLIGKHFGRLLVIREAGRNKFGHVQWECLCDCGNTKITTSNKLQNYTKSCGCLLKETAANTFKQYNKGCRISRGLDPDILIQQHNAALRDVAKDCMAECKARDNFTCRLCGNRGGYLNSHHIIPIKDNEQLSNDINNMATMCKKCHMLAHNNNTQGPVNPNIAKLLAPEPADVTKWGKTKK